MATAAATAMRQQVALERIEQATARLRERFELRLVDLAPKHRDAAIARADQLEQLAALIEQIEQQVRTLDLTDANNAEPKKALAEPAPSAAGKRKGEAR